MKRALHAVAVAAACMVATGAAAQDVLKVVIGQRGNWDTSVSELGQRAGIFKKHGLKLEIVYTPSANEALRTLMLGDADIAVAVGTMNVLAAHARGVPLLVVGAQMTGASDLYWYVKADSPVRSLGDGAAKTIAYSAHGSSTHRIVSALLRQSKLTAKPVPTGAPPGTLTQVMNGEIDVGWAAPPFGFDQLDRNQIRIVGRGNDASAISGQTLRVLVVMEQALKARESAMSRYMKAYRETIDWMYTSPDALREYAAWLDIPQAKARRMRDEFFPKEALNPDMVAGLDALAADAVTLKFIAKQPAEDVLRDLVRVPPR